MSEQPVASPDDADAQVDALVTGLVREYLYRKGHAEVLRIFDEETVSKPPQT